MLPVASCVVTKSDTLLDDKGKPVIRPYTPITPSDKQGELSILIKKYDTGKMSKHIFEMKVRAAGRALCASTHAPTGGRQAGYQGSHHEDPVAE